MTLPHRVSLPEAVPIPAGQLEDIRDCYEGAP
jgi:hypothetical protein